MQLRLTCRTGGLAGPARYKSVRAKCAQVRASRARERAGPANPPVLKAKLRQTYTNLNAISDILYSVKHPSVPLRYNSNLQKKVVKNITPPYRFLSDAALCEAVSLFQVFGLLGSEARNGENQKTIREESSRPSTFPASSCTLYHFSHLFQCLEQAMM